MPTTEALVRARAELECIQEFGRIIHSTRDRFVVYESFYQLLEQVVPIDHGTISFFDAQQNLRHVYVIAHRRGNFADEPVTIKPHTPSAWILRQRKPLLFENIYTDSHSEINLEHALGADLHHASCSWLGLPIMLGSQLLGLVTIQHHETAAYGDRELQLLQTLSLMLATTINQLQRVEELEVLRLALSAPTIPVDQHLWIVPVIGRVDQQRLAMLQTILLGHVERQRIRYVVLDLTGMRSFDPQATGVFNKLIGALRLLGATCIVSGVQAENSAVLSPILSQHNVLIVRDVQQSLRYLKRQI